MSLESLPASLETLLTSNAYYEREINKRMSDPKWRRPNYMKFLVTSENGESKVESLEVEAGKDGIAEIRGRPDQVKVGDTLEVIG